jgi:carbon-monoxide dehydrogenase large subunit
LRTTNRLIGSPIARVEDLRFLRGRGEYIDDVSRENQLCAFILRSPIAHGRLKAIDTKAALDMPGVHAVITASDLPRPMPAVNIRLQPLPSLVPFHQPVLALEKVRYVGEPIAVVLAASAALAEDAAGAIGLDIEPLPVVIDRYESCADKTLLFDPRHQAACQLGDVVLEFLNGQVKLLDLLASGCSEADCSPNILPGARRHSRRPS